MIFAKGDHIKQIIEGTKTQTRRVYHPEESREYKIGKTYSIQPGRTKPGIPDGRIKVSRIWFESFGFSISSKDALAEGGYTPSEYEDLFFKMHPLWRFRQCIEFEFVPSGISKETEK